MEMVARKKGYRDQPKIIVGKLALVRSNTSRVPVNWADLKLVENARKAVPE